MIEDKDINKHLSPIFDEVLPELTRAGIRYWVFGGIGVAGVNGSYVRENQDIDTYVLEEDFGKVELILRKLVEEHGAWDGDRWSLTYSMLKRHKRPRLSLNIKKEERFEVVPVYKIPGGIEVRVADIIVLSEDALVQEERVLEGYHFFSPPKEIIKKLLLSVIDFYIRESISKFNLGENSRHIIDLKAIGTKEEVEGVLERIQDKIKSNNIE